METHSQLFSDVRFIKERILRSIKKNIIQKELSYSDLTFDHFQYKGMFYDGTLISKYRKGGHGKFTKYTDLHSVHSLLALLKIIETRNYKVTNEHRHKMKKSDPLEGHEKQSHDNVKRWE